MFFKELSFRLQNTYSDKVQSFMPYRKDGVFLKFLLTAKSDNRGPKTEPMYVNFSLGDFRARPVESKNSYFKNEIIYLMLVIAGYPF